MRRSDPIGGIHLVDMSLDTFTPETYAQLRAGARLEVTRANVLRLLELKVQCRSRTRIMLGPGGELSFCPRTGFTGPWSRTAGSPPLPRCGKENSTGHSGRPT